MLMQKLIGSIYSVIIEIFLWFFPLAGGAAGYFGAHLYYGSDNIGYYVLGVFGGIIAGLLLDVILLGPVIVILNIRTSLKNIEDS